MLTDREIGELKRCSNNGSSLVIKLMLRDVIVGDIHGQVDYLLVIVEDLNAAGIYNITTFIIQIE